MQVVLQNSNTMIKVVPCIEIIVEYFGLGYNNVCYLFRLHVSIKIPLNCKSMATDVFLVYHTID